MKKSKSKRKGPTLGQMTTRFVNHLSIGLGEFGLNFEDFAPHTMEHEDFGFGFLFSQLSLEAHGQLNAASVTVFVTEDGVRFSNSKLMFFNNEQTPEKVALVFLAAMVTEEPFDAPICPKCE